MYEHLNTWTQDLNGASARLDLWDTGRTRDGKSEIRYALAIVPEDLDARPVVIDGEDFHPSPLHAIDSDTTAAGLLGFMAYYGETSDPEAIAGLTTRQLEALQTWREDISMWSQDLDPDA